MLGAASTALCGASHAVLWRRAPRDGLASWIRVRLLAALSWCGDPRAISRTRSDCLRRLTMVITADGSDDGRS